MSNLQELIFYYVKGVEDKTLVSEVIQKKCIDLFQKDYSIFIVENTDGILCPTYPPKIIVMESEAMSPSITSTTIINKKDIEEFSRRSRFSRVRTRFVVSSIFYNGKHICRSSTLSTESELLLNTT
jgi:hypothetical protein